MGPADQEAHRVLREADAAALGGDQQADACPISGDGLRAIECSAGTKKPPEGGLVSHRDTHSYFPR